MKNRLLGCAMGTMAFLLFGAETMAQESCPIGRSPISVTTPGGKTRIMCIPNSALPGIENAENNAPGTISPAQCPCFSPTEVAAAVTNAGGRYSYLRGELFDGKGNVCRYSSVEALGFSFWAVTKSTDPVEPCLSINLYPLTDIQPNGCYRKFDQTDGVLLRNIQPEESLVCVTTLDRYAQ